MRVYLQDRLDLLLAIKRKSIVLYCVSALCLLLALYFMLSYMVRKRAQRHSRSHLETVKRHVPYYGSYQRLCFCVWSHIYKL